MNSHPSSSPVTDDGVVERVAKALWEHEFGTEGKWPVNVANPEDWYAQARAALAASDRDVLVAENARLREALEGMSRLLETMQDRSLRFLIPEPYEDREGVVWSDGDPEPFASDMIYLLDGPEQREAQGKARAALIPLGGEV